MEKKIFLGSFMILLLLSISSCNDDEFLKEDPKTFFTLDNVFSSPAQVNQVITSLYSLHRSMNSPIGWYPNEVFLWKGNGTDVIDGNYYYPTFSMSNYTVFNVHNAAINNLYNDFYSLIAKANLAIMAANLPQISWASEEDKTYVIAQARFFRAFAYCNLAELWGGVPLVTEVIQIGKVDFKRETATAIYQYAIDELLAIENDLPITTIEGGKIVRGAAQHFLCQLYLGLGIQLEEDKKTDEAQTAYTNSISYGNKVIDGGTFSLMTSRFGTRKNESLFTINIYKNGVPSPSEIVDTLQLTPNFYWDLFQEGNVNYQDGNMECIWAVQYDFDAFMTEDRAASLQHPATYGGDFSFGTAFAIMNTINEEGSGYSGACQTPTWYSRENIWEGKWGADIRNSEVIWRKRFKGNVPGSDWYLKVIPWSVFYGDPSGDRYKINISFVFPISCKITTDKFRPELSIKAYIFRDDYAIRLPETILLRAEAKQRKGDKTGAAYDVNLVRSRANCAYFVTAADMDDNFNMILDERARELMYEEKRWNTLLRMRGTIAVERIKKYMMWDDNRATLTSTFNKLPIPQKVIDSNFGNIIEQNPGW